jgi:hypothetical protein
MNTDAPEGSSVPAPLVAPVVDLHLEIDSEGLLRTKLYDKTEDLNVPIVNFPFIHSNIPAAPIYSVYIFQSIRYSRAWGSYPDIGVDQD